MLINKKTLSDQIYDILKMEILKREIPFGSKLVNRTLQKKFGVSSSPIRDAINRLNQDGLITSIDKSGATVVDFDYDFFLEVNEVILYVVNTGVKLSFEKSDTEEVCKYLEKYLLLQEKYIGTDEFYDYDYKFHKTFIKYSKNTRLEKIFKEYNVLHEMLVRSYYEPETFQIQEDSIKMHKQILGAFRNKNYGLAMTFTEEHYKGAEKIFKKMFEEKKEKLKEGN
ncbi:GntR family transcriptional regulator [Clostridium tetani]|uniref:GntR family transcriptional regulator n=1 Tax=Clostridium tetani TaxID=1513 RepID=A0A4Q0VFL0_CLOTA|nr:GntR family transcriptional regulator [Clostridium tetani]AVP55612.1 GntR family transcriptional regulator [Clostridium tetani]KGI40580.1 GntR family transcriptional regulator [Clostridium tetani ATCC 9441]KGI42532.1 GntR family transcriptional regulator [Clostridium tetani]RXI43920.1 GntR family transcriptional regulator [Clostridium tetani]RXI49709.1 GntR family transcriptional regulator [Clostridium tetani]